MKKTRVVLVHTASFLNLRGAERWLFDVAHYLSLRPEIDLLVADFQADVDPRVGLDRERRQKAVEEALRGIRWREFRFVDLSSRRLKTLTSLRFVPFDTAFLGALRESDVVWFMYSGNGPGSLPMTMLCALLAGRKPFIISIHAATDVGKRRSVYLRFYRRIGLLRAVHVVSEADGKKIQSALGISTEFIPNGVDCERFTPGDAPHGKFTVLFVGALEKKKGADILPAIYELLRTFPIAGSFEMVVVTSGGKLVDSIESWCRGKPDVIFGGLATGSELVEFYRRAGVVIFPSRSEAFGLIPLEAQACGTPAIVWSGTGFRGSVKDGETGFVVDKYGPESFADAVVRVYDLWRTGEPYERMRRRARLYMLETFSIERVAEQVAQLIRSVRTG